MPENNYSSSDVPEFASYPAEPPVVEEPNHIHAVKKAYRPALFGDDFETGFRNRLHDGARRMGAALGETVVALRENTAKVQRQLDVLRAQAEERIAPVKAAAGETTDSIIDSAQGALDEARLKARGIFQDGRSMASESRAKARQTVNEYPLHVIAAAGAAALLTGAAIRYWEGKRNA